jgi:N-acetyl-anhydromuramyl-L-alanine amidase AmpD
MKEFIIQTDYLRTGAEREEGKCNSFNDPKNGGEPKWIMEHHTVGDYASTINTFLTQEVSAHYVIDKNGTIQQLVQDTKRAWHAGVGALKENSKLNNNITSQDILKNDMNSWSIGIEHVNSGNEPFTKEQMRASIYLHEQLVNEHKTDRKMLISHAEWTPGRKIDPSPYFDWRALANASTIEGIEHNFGVYPSELELSSDPEIILSWQQNKQQKTEIEELQRRFEELGYPIIEAEDANLGVYDKKLQNACLSFKIRYMNEIITNDPAKIELWEKIAYPDPSTPIASPTDMLSAWDQNDDKALGEVLDLYGE